MYINLIMICFFRPGMKDDTYYVRLTVDGKKVPENKHCGSATSSKCRFRVRVCEITYVGNSNFLFTLIKINFQ